MAAFVRVKTTVPTEKLYTNMGEVIRTLSRRNKNETICSRRKLSGFSWGKVGRDTEWLTVLWLLFWVSEECVRQG